MTCPFPPPYTIRISKRATRPGLRIRADVGLEVVLPCNQQHIDVAALISNHADWIRRHYERITIPSGEQITKITDGFFIHGGQEYVSFTQEALSEDALRRRASALLPGAITPRAITQRPIDISLPPPEKRVLLVQCLRQWVIGKAKRVFSPRLQSLASENGLSFNRCAFKLQKSRWGSCSIKRNININANILFLPPALARYVLLHELCHLYHLNHSDQFWQKLFRFDPQAIRHDKALRFAAKYLPWDRL